MWEFAGGLAALAGCLLVSIALHEIGHLIPAKKFGVSVSQYMVGFGPTLFSRHFRGTEYGLKMLPLGGYIRMSGMYPDDLDTSPTQTGVFYRLSTGKRVVIMFAGPFVNLMLAALLLMTAFWGFGSVGVGIQSVSACTPRTASAECTDGDAAAPASGLLQKEDVLIAIDSAEISSWDQVVMFVQSHPNESIELTVVRDGAELQIPVELASMETANLQLVGFLGVTPTTVIRPQSFSAALNDSIGVLRSTLTTLVMMPVSAAQTAMNLITPADANQDRPVSIIGAGQVAGAISAAPSLSGDVKAQTLVLLGGQINLALFIFNMIPLPPFDGGHIAVALWQKVRERWYLWKRLPKPAPINVQRLMPVTLSVLMAFGLASLIFMLADVFTPII